MARTKAAGLAALLLFVVLLPFASGADSTVSVNTTWSGNIALAGNVTVASGVTLTVSPGTQVDAGPYAIVVHGTMEADQAVFFSSVVPETQGSHGQGLWPGIEIESSGTGLFSSVTVANASAGVMVKGSLTASDLTLNDAYRGVAVLGGTANLTDVEAHRIDYEALYVESGQLVVDGGWAQEVAIGVANHGTANLTDLTVEEAGVGAQSLAGTLTLLRFGVVNASVGLATVAGASTSVTSMLGQGLALGLDVSNADDFTLETATLKGDRLMVGQATTSLFINDLSYTSTSTQERRPALDVSCDGTCQLAESSLDGSATGVAWSGTGTSVMSNVSVAATVQGVEVTGSGHFVGENLSLQAPQLGLAVQTPTSTLSNVDVQLMSNDGIGVDVLGGQHEWTDLTVHKTFASGDSTSIGVNAWYADLVLDRLTVRNTSTGLLLEDSSAMASSTEANIGNLAGLHLIDSSFRGEALVTVAQDEGVLLEGASVLHLSSWTAQLHDTPLMMSSGTDAVVRSFSPMNTAPSSADALGDGTLHYGSSGNPTISTTFAHRLLETAVTFTDLQGNPVEADVLVHDFALKANSNGALTLPLTAAGSVVDATLDGSGVRTVLYGGQSGQSVQVPVIPNGDWTVGSGQDIVLGARPDGQPHVLSGDLVVANNGRLTLVNTILNLETGSTVTLQGTGVLQGESATLSSPWVQASGQSMLTGTTGGKLTVLAEVQWGCLNLREVEHLVINGNLTVQPGCDISLGNGSVNGHVTAQTGATFTSTSSLQITVLDKGLPVEGALISIDGNVGVTDASGYLATTADARTVTDMGESWAGLKTVTLQRNNFTDFVSWDTNTSMAHTFMTSTVASGSLNQWLVLERQWSPYMLDGDLMLETGSTMTVQDGVSLRITEGSTITVNGLLDVGAATLSSTGFGARWGGLGLGSSAGAVIKLAETQLVESSPALTVSGYGEVQIDGAMLARSASEALIVVESGSQADLTVRNTHLQDSGNGCIIAYPSTGQVTLTDVSFSDCEGAALWSQQTPLAINGLTFLDGVEQGLDLTGVTGTVINLDAHQFTGEGPIVSINSLRGNFQLSGLEGTVTGSGGLVGMDNVDIDLADIDLTGAPAIDLDLTSGTMIDVRLTGEGSGTAFTTHHGRSSDHLTVENLSIEDYAVGVSLHSDPGEISSPLILRSSAIDSMTALATEHFPVRLESSTLVGGVELSATEVVAVDGLVETVTPLDGATFSLYRTMTLDARREGSPVAATFTVEFGDGSADTVTVSGTTVDVELLLRTVTAQSDTVMPSWTVGAQVVNSPPASVTLSSPTTAPQQVVIPVQTNQPPTVSLVEPYAGQRVMETDSLRASAIYSDDLDAADAIVLSWKVYDLQGNEVLGGGNEPVFNLTDLSAGFYVIEVTATDSLGLSSTDSTDIEYTQLDSDGDWTSTCSSDSWFDATTGKPCGPNLYDEDDDNDGFSDSKDAFPLDPCAQVDTDGDTQPDVLDCPAGFTSWLTEDMDDDGDGVPDVLEGVSTDDSDVDLNALLVVLALLVVVVLLFFARLRRGGPGDLTGLDQRHL